MKRANSWRGIIGAVLFMCAFSYLNPFLDKIFHPYQRYQRIVVCLTQIYTCLIIFLLHQVSSCISERVAALIRASPVRVPGP